MSYQIKRTPYFRRMFNNSRRNGQLQRLREEYERIQEFNDRTIELKMRQVRLKRLFREIEDINESPSTSNGQRRQQLATATTIPTTLLPLTPEALHAQQRRERLEALERARELGQEISRRNAQMAETGAGYYLRSELRLTAKMRAVDDARREALERRQRAARRISYGNAQSRSNLERIVQRRQRRITNANANANVESTPATSLILDTGHHVAQLAPNSSSQSQLHTDLLKRAMLQQRLQYGNSRSSNNMMRSQLAAAHRVLSCVSATDALEEEEAAAAAAAAAQLQRHRQLQRQRQRQRQLQPLSVDQFSASGSSNHNMDSDADMQTAMLPPTELEMLRLMPPDNNNNNSKDNKDNKDMGEDADDDEDEDDTDDVPTTSQNALKLGDVSTTVTTYPTLEDAKSELATQRWQRISLTLPWIKVMHEQPLIATGTEQLANISIAIGGDQLGNNSTATATGAAMTTTTTTTMTATTGNENYQSIRGPSLMQEDLLQIMELDDDGQVPTRHLQHALNS